MTFAISSLYYFNVKEPQVKSEPVWQTRVKTNVILDNIWSSPTLMCITIRSSTFLLPTISDISRTQFNRTCKYTLNR